jgi:sulfite reductase (NADPH) hemoprotein beta-component
VFVGGGMGRTPMIAPEINPFVREDELISYVEAVPAVYNRYGRRDNKYKARIKILVHELGVEEYRRQVAEEFAHMKTLGIDPPREELARIRAFCRSGLRDRPVDDLDRSTRFRSLGRPQCAPHKQPGYAIVNISLKPSAASPAMRAPSRSS